jgi:WD40-like Beta Propeller Repeat
MTVESDIQLGPWPSRWGACLLAFGLAGCASPQPSSFNYYDERIAPILDVGCARQTTGCHVDDGRGFALGNLDLSSYDALMRRPDVLDAYGPYPVGVLLLKAGDPVEIDVQTFDPPDPSEPSRRRVRIRTDVRHGGGGAAVAQGSPNYATLKQWIDGGHARNGVFEVQPRASTGACVSAPGRARGVDVSGAPRDAASYARFVADVQPILKQRCAGSDCHGARLSDLYLACGDDAAQTRWNYEISVQHLDETGSLSELLRRPLAMTAGGVYHEGGDVFEDGSDPDYEVLFAWASDIAKRAPHLLVPPTEAMDEGLRFFANRVQPLLVRKGCMFQNCHSPAMFHDLRLHGGSQGAFSALSTHRNHEMSKHLLALDSADPNQSRFIAKNLCAARVGGQGIQHRGGALFEDFGGCASEATRAHPGQCDGVDAEAGDLNELPAYCVLARWHAIERELAVERGELPSREPPSAVVFVTRPAGVGSVLDFDTFRPGADLVRASASYAADGGIELGTPESLLGACGLGASPDIRGLSVSWDAQKIAFGARRAADAPLRLYELSADGAACAPIAGLAPDEDAASGILLHDFDPAYAPDGRLVFASTRGHLGGDTALRGPTRTPASLAPNANLYVYDPLAPVPLRQLTYLSNQELLPSFMADGRVIYTTEKRSRDFHQLALRRQNLDGADYHPLFAQRPSVGFSSATEVVELANKNLALVASELGAADGGGSIVVVNRSIGPDQDDRDPADRGYTHSITWPAAGALDGGTGVFRSPAALPSGRMLASCDLDAGALQPGPHRYGLCELDAADGGSRVLWRDASRVALSPRPLWARVSRGAFVSRADEANGSTRIEPGETDAIVHYTDLPMLATLLFSNTREGRPIPVEFETLQVFESRPAPATARTWDDVADAVVSDEFGRYYEDLVAVGSQRLEADGSLRVRMPAGMPIVLGAADARGKLLQFGDAAPFAGLMRQREEIQFYPGERAMQSVPRRFFRGLCAGCHGSITGRELDVVVDVDALTSASKTLAAGSLLELR